MPTLPPNNDSSGDRRLNTDRRKFSYTAHAPERRSGSGRRRSQERRMHERLRVKKPTFATLWNEQGEDYIEKDGLLLDISKGGVSLRCVAKPEESEGYSSLDIFLSDYDFNVDRIPFKVTSDIEMTSASTMSEPTLRRYGIKFEKMTPEQISKLHYFLTYHTFIEV